MQSPIVVEKKTASLLGEGAEAGEFAALERAYGTAITSDRRSGTSPLPGTFVERHGHQGQRGWSRVESGKLAVRAPPRPHIAAMSSTIERLGGR